MRQVLERLGNPQDSFQVVQVAGTNGKGSTAAFVEAGLLADGRSTGLFTNPHLVRFRDSIRIDGQDISPERLRTAGEEACTANDWEISVKIVAPSRERFEFMIAIAFSAFRRARVGWAVVETKVGGRRDATSAFRPAISVITPIDLDHQETLGNTIQEIAAEKAGILKPGVPAVIAPQRAESSEVIEARARGVGAPLILVGRDWKAEQVGHDRGYYRFAARRWERDRPTEVCIPVELPLAGEHQVVNALTAVATLDALDVSALAISEGLKQARFPGRLEHIPGEPEFLLDAAHNPAAARALARFLQGHDAGRRVHLIYASGNLKVPAKVLAELLPVAHQVVLTTTDKKSSIPPEQLRTLVGERHPNVRTSESVREGFVKVCGASGPADLVVVTGSIALVGQAREALLPPAAVRRLAKT